MICCKDTKSKCFACRQLICYLYCRYYFFSKLLTQTNYMLVQLEYSIEIAVHWLKSDLAIASIFNNAVLEFQSFDKQHKAMEVLAYKLEQALNGILLVVFQHYTLSAQNCFRVHWKQNAKRNETTMNWYLTIFHLFFRCWTVWHARIDILHFLPVIFFTFLIYSPK